MIAVAADKNGKIWKGHFGISPVYLLFDNNGNPVETKTNPFAAGEKGHQHHDDPKLIVNLLSDCGVFIAKRMGDQSKKNLVEKMNVIPFITEKENPSDAVKDYFEFKGK